MGVQSTRFQTTSWSLLAATTADDVQQRQAALAELTRLYLPPIRAFVASIRSLPNDDVDDVVQGFIQSRWLEQNLAGRAQADKGRFRSYVLKSVTNYVSDRLSQIKKERQRVRGSIETSPEADSILDASDSPNEAFDRAWAREILARAVEQMRQQCEQDGQSAIWGVFQDRLFGPALYGSTPVAYSELVQRFNFASPSQASNALVTAKRMFARTLRSVLAEFDEDEMTIEDAVQELHCVLTRNGKR